MDPSIGAMPLRRSTQCCRSTCFLPRAIAKPPPSLRSLRGLGCLTIPQARHWPKLTRPCLCDEVRSTAGAVRFSPLLCYISRYFLATARQGARRSNETSVLLGSLREPRWCRILPATPLRRACAGAIVFALSKASGAEYKA